MTPLLRRADPAATAADAPMIDATLALLAAVHARDGLEQRVLTRLDYRVGVPDSERNAGWVPSFVSKTPFASAAFASAAFGIVAVAALGGAVFLAHSRPAPGIFVPAHVVVGNAAPVLSRGPETRSVEAAGATAVAQKPIHPHTHGRSHRIGRAVHARTAVPPGATLPRQLDLHAPQPLAVR